MKNVLRAEIESIHEMLDQIENIRVHKRERVQPKGVRVENKEYDGEGFDEEDDQNQ